ncbi:hypothetical protein [Methanocorpusculum parvum]|uniref:Uncharacterized protein n=1 Tax=Methanocorpusculum parvum TaxID=2193 RepID=A0AAX0Q8R9_9EURY|nr:hypothetical protein [Methanocorpusculum parvum]PAV09596.1 hypothetical protein ASJ83_06180 [Methanocorpusculum parvum]
MASSKLSEKDTQTIIRYAKELSNTLNKYGNENTEWEEIRLDMFQALSEKYPDFEEIQNLYADCLYILSGGHSYYYTKDFYYEDAVKYVQKLARLSGKYPLNEKIAERYAGALEALCRSDLQDKEFDWDPNVKAHNDCWMFIRYAEINRSLKLLTTIYPNNLSVFRSFLEGMSTCILESKFDAGYKVEDDDDDDDDESTAGWLRNKLEAYVFSELEALKKKDLSAVCEDVVGLFTFHASNMFEDLIDDLVETYPEPCEHHGFDWHDEYTDYLNYIGLLKRIDDFIEKLYRRYPENTAVIEVYSRIQLDLFVHTKYPELGEGPFHAEKEKKLLELYKKHKDCEEAAENYAGYLKHISMSENITASMRRMNKTKLKRLAKQFPENTEILRSYEGLTKYLEGNY